jgi:hypothetical protein
MNKIINFRCDEKFELLLKDKMKKAGYNSSSEFIRSSVENSNIKQRCKGLNNLLFEINKIGVNLNQISKHSNQDKIIDNLVLKGINDIYSQLAILSKAYTK